MLRPDAMGGLSAPGVVLAGLRSPMRHLRSFAHFLLTSLFLVGCQADEEPTIRESKQLLTPEEQRTLRFELASDWHVWAGQGTIANDTLSSEGAHSLSVASTDPSNGYIAVRNLTPLTKDDQPTPEIVGFDIWIPSQQSNPWWHGDAQLSIEAPSAGVWSQYLGYRSFNDLPKDQFVRVEFP